MEDALYALAESATGTAPEMYWSMDLNLVRRENGPLFERLSKGGIPSSRALEVFINQMITKTTANISMIRERYNRVMLFLTSEEQNQLETVVEFEKFFNGEHLNSGYATDLTIMSQEILPYFESCAVGTLSPREASDAVLANWKLRRELYLEGIQDLTRRLTEEMVATGIYQTAVDRSHTIKGDYET